MRKLSLLIFLASTFCLAQTNTISFTVQDTAGVQWPYATWSIDLYNPSGGQRPININTGQPVITHYAGTLPSTALLSQAVTPNADIVPSGTAYVITICPIAGPDVPCQKVGPYVDSVSSSKWTQNLNPLQVPAAFNMYGYNPNEIVGTPLFGSVFWINSLQLGYYCYIYLPTPAPCIQQLNARAFQGVFISNGNSFYNQNPLSINYGGTGAQTASGAVANIVNGNNISPSMVTAGQMYTSYYAGSCTQTSNRASWCPTSSTDYGAIINAAISAMPVVSGYPEGTVILPAVNNGLWATTVTVNSPYVSIIGAGRSASSFSCTVNADCLLIETVPFTTQPGGRFQGFSLTGNNGSSQNGIHVANIIGASFRDLSVQSFGSGAALWMDNLQNGAWTERNSFVNCWFSLAANDILFSTESTSTNSFGYTRMLDVQLNTSGTSKAIYVRGSGVGSVVYHSTFRFTLNADNTSGPEVEIDAPSTIQNSEFYMFAENQTTGSYMYNVQSNSSFSVIGQTFATGFGNNLIDGQFIQQSVGGNSNSQSISSGQNLILVAAQRLNGILNITLGDANTVETDSYLVNANQSDPNVTVTVLAHRCANGTCVSSTGNPYVVEDSSGNPQLVLNMGTFTGSGNVWAQWYGVNNIDGAEVLPNITLGTTTTTNNPNLASLIDTQSWSGTQTFSNGIAIGSDSIFHAGPRSFISFSTGPIASIVTGNIYMTAKIQQNATIENINGAASTFTCTTNPVLEVYDCGTVAGSCTSPTQIASLTITSANNITDGAITNPSITAGHYLALETLSGSCTSLRVGGTIEYKMQ